MFPLTLPTLICSAYPKDFIVSFTHSLLKSGPLSLYSPYKKINKNKNISLPYCFFQLLAETCIYFSWPYPYN